MDAVAQELLKHGILGALLVAASIYIWRLQKDLRHIQEKRTADAQAVTDKLLQLNDKWNQTITTHTTAQGAVKDALDEVKEAIREFRLQRGR